MSKVDAQDDDDPIDLAASASAVAAAEPEPDVEVAADQILSVHARVEYAALPRGQTQNIFGLVTVQAGAAPPEVPAEGEEGERGRQPMDIICVLDVSGSMQGDKIRQVQDAMRFIVEQAQGTDRLSIVTFNHEAQRPLRLRKMDAEGKNDAMVATLRLKASGGTSIVAGMNLALSVMEQRRQRNKVSAVLLLTDGQDRAARGRQALAERAARAHCSLYCFGFGADHDAMLLSQMAEQAKTPFTFVEDVEAIREAFAGALGGLSSTVAQAVALRLSGRVPLAEVHTPFPVTRESDRVVTVAIPDIMAQERKDIVVELSVPAEGKGHEGRLLLVESFATYTDLRQNRELQTASAQMWTERCDEPEMEPDEEVAVQRERVEVTRALKQAAAASEEARFEEAQRLLEVCEQRVMSNRTVQSPAMQLELQDARRRTSDRCSWETGGRAEVSDAMHMHSFQRCTNLNMSPSCEVPKFSKTMYLSEAQGSMISKSRRPS